MSGTIKKGVAQSYAFDAFNQADHAKTLIESAQAAVDREDYAEALRWLEQAKRPASEVEFRVNSAIDYLKNR